MPNTALQPRKCGIPLLAFTFLAKWTGWPTYKALEITELLLEQGSNPNFVCEGYTLWQYWIHSLHSRIPKENKRLRDDYKAALIRVFRLFLRRGVDLYVCCIKDFQVWENLYATEHLHPWVVELRDALIKHSKHQGFHEIGNSPVIGAEAIEEQNSFEQLHCLTAVVKDCFNTEEDPYGADELLDLIAKLKTDKKTPKVTQHHAEASTGRKRNKGQKKGKKNKT